MIVTRDSLLRSAHPLGNRRACVIVVDGLQDGTSASPDDLHAGLPGAQWYPHHRFDADGAGSTTFAIWRPGVLCLMSWDVPAGIDSTGAFITGDTEHVEMTCVEATTNETPDASGSLIPALSPPKPPVEPSVTF